jgi:hypothetical protein
VRRRSVVVTALLVAAAVVLVTGLEAIRTSVPAAASEDTPADVFMRSMAVRDGRLGWQQLCPSAQAELPVEAVVQETDALRAQDAATGVSVTVDFVRADPRPQGGEQRTYLATAWQFGAPLARKAFVVLTQASGCVEGLD